MMSSPASTRNGALGGAVRQFFVAAAVLWMMTRPTGRLRAVLDTGARPLQSPTLDPMGHEPQ